MSLFDFFSEDNCDETEEYLESVADYMESVLENELRAPVDRSTRDIETHAKVLLAYMVFACHAISRENPNVDLTCERAVGGVGLPRLKKWTSIPQSSDVEDRLFEHGMKAIDAGGSYREGVRQVMEFVFASDVDVPVGLFDSIFKAEHTLFEAIKRHDADRQYEEWIVDEIAIQEAQEYGQEMAERVRTYLLDNYQISANSEDLSRHEEAVIGIFFLCCLPRLVRLAEEGRALLSTSAFALREGLEGLPDDSGMLAVSYSILMSPSDTYGKKEVRNIMSWAIAHSKNRKFELGDDWTEMDFPGERSLSSVFDDALQFHGV